MVTGKNAPDLSGPRYNVLLTLTLPRNNVPPTTTPTPRTSYTPDKGTGRRGEGGVREGEVMWGGGGLVVDMVADIGWYW